MSDQPPAAAITDLRVRVVSALTPLAVLGWITFFCLFFVGGDTRAVRQYTWFTAIVVLMLSVSTLALWVVGQIPKVGAGSAEDPAPTVEIVPPSRETVTVIATPPACYQSGVREDLIRAVSPAQVPAQRPGPIGVGPILNRGATLSPEKAGKVLRIMREAGSR